MVILELRLLLYHLWRILHNCATVCHWPENVIAVSEMCVLVHCIVQTLCTYFYLVLLYCLSIAFLTRSISWIFFQGAKKMMLNFWRFLFQRSWRSNVFIIGGRCRPLWLTNVFLVMSSRRLYKKLYKICDSLLTTNTLKKGNYQFILWIKQIHGAVRQNVASLMDPLFIWMEKHSNSTYS